MTEADMTAGADGTMRDVLHIEGVDEGEGEGKGEGTTTIGIAGTIMEEIGIEDEGTMMNPVEVGEAGEAGEGGSMTALTVEEMVMGPLRALPPEDMVSCPRLQLLMAKCQHLLRYVAVFSLRFYTPHL